ncbi:MAG: T9SS type A sorting domain-containing protein, partial [Bacteroidota bacterium]
TGDGSTPIFDPLTYIFRNPNTLDTIDIDITGNNKLFVKVKSSIPGTSFRIDVQDVNSFVSTQGSITKLVDTTFKILEYDFTGVLADMGFGGTPCTMSTAPCPVDGSRIADLLFFIEPGAGGFTGTLTIDYLSFGVSLEPLGPEPDLIYEDQFNNETLEYTGVDVGGIIVEEIDTDLLITGDGTSGPFSAVSYILHDKESGEQIFLDMSPASDKVFIRAKVDSGTVPLRMDLIDTTGFITSQQALTRVLTDEFAIYEFDFSGAYIDGGFGGPPCDVAPCTVDAKAITQMLIYPDPVVGGFEGVINVDFISIGQPLGEDPGVPGITDYVDLMDDNTSIFLTDAPGLSSVTANDEWTISGDGTAGPWTPIVYETHNDMGETVLVNAVGNDNKLFVRAKSSVDSTELRIDVQDKLEFVTNLNAVSNIIGTEYEIYEYDYTGAYQDGAFGGSPCTTSGCPVDGERIKALQFFIKPGVGGFNGSLSIDWISFGSSSVGFEDPELLLGFNAYPNPSMGMLEVSYVLKEAANVELRLSDLFGKSLISQPLGTQFAGQHSSRLNLESLAAGVYMLQVRNEGQIAGSLKIIKR